jgi:hypothetical protein
MIFLDYDLIDPEFKNDLIRSDKSVFLVAQYLRLNGHSVTLPPIKIRPDTSTISEYGDGGDLMVESNIIEVKQRPDLHFNSLSEFPYNTIIVDVKHHYDRMVNPPKYYIICNSGLNGAIVVSNKTRNKWITSTRWDRKRNRNRTFYLIEKKYCNFWNFNEKPKFIFN